MGNLRPYQSASVNKGFYILKQPAQSVVCKHACCSCESCDTQLLFKIASKMAAQNTDITITVIINLQH